MDRCVDLDVGRFFPGSSLPGSRRDRAMTWPNTLVSDLRLFRDLITAPRQNQAQTHHFARSFKY
jgi:hypothetical protein